MSETRNAEIALPEPVSEPPRPWCDCGPGYRLGDETGICRTCAQSIWWEIGAVGGRERVGWSDRTGGDSIVCFKADGYRHVPMGSREEAIYRAGVKAAALVDKVSALADEWDGYGHGRYNVHLEERLPCSACDLLADLRALLEADRG